MPTVVQRSAQPNLTSSSGTENLPVDDMQKAYINESRVSSLDQLLIVQQYSPDLFSTRRITWATHPHGSLAGQYIHRGGARRVETRRASASQSEEI